MKQYVLFLILFIMTISCKSQKDKNFKEIWNSQDSLVWNQNNLKKLESIADLAYQKDEYSNAVILYSKLIEFDTTNGKYYYNRGYSYSMLLNMNLAIQDYLKSISLNYRVSKAYQNIGINYGHINDSIAIYYFKKAIENDSKNEKAKTLLDECIKRIKKSKAKGNEIIKRDT